MTFFPALDTVNMEHNDVFQGMNKMSVTVNKIEESQKILEQREMFHETSSSE